MNWRVDILNETVAAELAALPEDMRADFWHIAELIEERGLERMREPHVKKLHGSIWEMRMKGRDGISRALYVTAVGKRVIVLRAFIKKTQQTPSREIEIAIRRAKEIK